MARIFISYRRDDSAAHAGRLYDRLEYHFGQGQVFMDVDAIKPGLDFVEVVQEAVSVCDGLVAVIGKEWLHVSNPEGGRRLEDPDDMVRLEIATALERGIPVIPVLVQGAQMPRGNDLPNGLKPLANRNALEVSDTRFRSDVDRLIETLEAPTQDRLADTVFVEPAQVASSTFVGRDREMGELNKALEASLAGQGRLVMLVGEPGIGKTRTAQELASRAESRGAQVLWGRCYEEEGAPPYWPWVQPLRAWVERSNAHTLQSQMRAGAANIAEIVPELRDKLTGLNPPPALEPESARFRLFDSIATFFKNASRSQPIVLVLDDLHWADRSSLLLLEFVAHEIADSSLLLIGTYRDVEVTRRHPLSQSLGTLIREQTFQSLELKGLNQQEVGQLAEATRGSSLERIQLEAVHGRTEGNPLFVGEIVRLLEREGGNDGQGWDIRIPSGIKDVIGRRLDGLTEECNRALTVASVIGREFELRQLVPLVDDVSEDRLLEVLEEALTARVIEELPQAVGRYQFTHALIQETLTEELSTTRKVRLHARIAEAFEELYSSNIEAHAAELAHHFAEAQTVLGTGKLIRYSSLAGERALATYAYEEALAHIQRALAAKEVPLTGSQPAQDLQEADLLFGLVRAQVATSESHEMHEAVVTIGRAFDYYAGSGEIDQAAAVAEVSFIGYPGTRTGVAGLLARALALVPPDSHQAGRLLSRYARVLAMEEGDDEGSRKAFDHAMAIARQEGDTVLEMRTLAVGAETDVNYLRRHNALEKALRALGLARDADDPMGELTARFFAVLALRETGNPQEAERHASALLHVAERVKDRTRTALALHGNDSIHSYQGNWAAARSYSDMGLVCGSLTPVFHGMRAHFEYEIGDSAQGDINFRAFVEIIRGIPLGPGVLHAQAALVIPLVGRIIGRLDDADLARQAAEAVISSTNSTPVFAGMARAGLALLETLEGHTSEVRKHYENLKVWQGATVHSVALSGDRMLGILAQSMGEMDRAMVHFEDAMTFRRKAGYRPELAWTCCDYADTLRERDGEGDRAKAITRLDESLSISSELGMRPLMERVLSRREVLGA